MDAAKNFAKGILDAGIDDNDTTLTLSSTTPGTRFPTTPFNAVIWNSTDYPDPADDPDVEVVRVTNISTNTLTITRGQEGTEPAEHHAEGKTHQIIAPLTAKVINEDLAPVSRLGFNDPVFTICNGESAKLEFDLANGVAALGDVDGLVEGTKIVINDPLTRVTITKQLILPDLPTSNPAIAGALWNDGGTVKISAG